MSEFPPSHILYCLGKDVVDQILTTPRFFPGLILQGDKLPHHHILWEYHGGGELNIHESIKE